MKLELLCNYCGKSFSYMVYRQEELAQLRCPYCKDRNLKNITKEAGSGDAFGYEKDTPVEDAWIKKT